MDERDEQREHVEDLDVPDSESEDVKGGALNAYFESATGEKQGKAAQRGVYIDDIIIG